ncbi:MAG: ATP-dependent helicase, partial [Rubrivivax sp.]
AHNPRSRLAGFRVAQLVPGIGPASAKRLLDAMAGAPEPLVALRAFKPPPAAKADWAEFCAVYEALLPSQAAGDVGTWPADFDQAKRWYLPRLEQLYDDHTARRIDLDQLGQLTGGYPSRERFLTELTLDPPDATSAESGAPHRDEDYVILSTIHSAKGQEWKAVFMLNVVDGCIPADLATGSREDIDEERRLLYVAMTRAKDHLHVMVPQRFYVTQQGSGGDRHVYGARTRFIPAALEPLFELTASEAVARAHEPLAQPGKTIDLAARARSRWG